MSVSVTANGEEDGWGSCCQQGERYEWRHGVQPERERVAEEITLTAREAKEAG